MMLPKLREAAEAASARPASVKVQTTEGYVGGLVVLDAPTVLALLDVADLAEHWAEGLPRGVQQAVDRLRTADR
jgi:hypothetical protein